MEGKIPRKYNSDFRKNLKQKLSKLTSKSEYLEIYKIIISEQDNKLSINRNGIYFNLNGLSDKAIEKIYNLITYKIETETCTEQNKITYESYNKDVAIENFIQDKRLTNQEKSLIKKFRQKELTLN
jgi:hypothetical protein